MAQLKVGQAFPAMTVALVDGWQIRLPDDLQGRFAILLFYRAWW